MDEQDRLVIAKHPRAGRNNFAASPPVMAEEYEHVDLRSVRSDFTDTPPPGRHRDLWQSKQKISALTVQRLRLSPASVEPRILASR